MRVYSDNSIVFIAHIKCEVLMLHNNAAWLHLVEFEDTSINRRVFTKTLTAARLREILLFLPSPDIY